MPMSWTPENDRLLLLKLIETHGIKVDSGKIEKAWRKYPFPHSKYMMRLHSSATPSAMSSEL
jgi:hypothetical protein